MKWYFYNSAHYEKWDWRTPDTTGIGNSETQIVEVSRLLAARGHRVRCFAPLPGEGGFHDGAEWLPLEEANKHFRDEGIWVVSRSPGVLSHLRQSPVEGRKVWFVSQDVEYGDAITPEQTSAVDRFLALCPEHANYLRKRYPFLTGKICISSNGARVGLFEKMEAEGIRRDPYCVVHTSSPDRGLLQALAIFKRAREFEPSLELHVCYGFQNLQASASKIRKKNIDNIQKHLDQPGVINHGRLNQPDLYRLLLSAGIWLYVTDFTETGCASHLEAMCAGCVPVFSPLWAMEHNGGFGMTVHGHSEEPITQCRAYRAVLRLSWDHALQEGIRQQMVPWARRQFAWERVADQYEMMVHEPSLKNYAVR